VPRHYDFEKFGPVTRTPLSRIQKIAGVNLLASYQTIPHVTNFDRANVSDIEALRQQVNDEQSKAQIRLTMLAFLIKASALALKAYPRFNASLDGDELVVKSYINIGFAADTPKGLLVPVIQDAGSKGLIDIARDIQALSQKARDSSLSVSDMQGGTFTVSSLGGIGGDGFTPLINAPEVAILGAGRASTEALWASDRFVPALMLPVSLSWDHRVVDGVAAARFLRFVCEILGDFRRAAL
jgi:pyruvate dehydrogenase E2 component (dihydrolipoamide acetyltransferase)